MTVRRQARAGRIPSLTVGRRRTYPRVLLDPWLRGERIGHGREHRERRA